MASHLFQRRTLLLAALVLSTLSGCRSTGLFRPPGPTAPIVLQEATSAPQVVSAINANTARVRSYYTSNARFTVPGMAGIPMLRGNIALERPMNFRLTAGIALGGGDQIDLGSNDEILWFWVKQNSPPALYYCRHDQFANSGARQVLPVDPTWVGDALGLVELDPNIPYQGPVARQNGTLELRAVISTPTGPMTRVLVIDAAHAWVLEQHLYDGSGGPPVASAIAEDFRYDESSQVSLPRHVTIRVPASQLALTIDVGDVAINQAIPGRSLMFSPPALDNYPKVDLGSTAAGVAFDPRTIPTPAVVPVVESAPTTIISPPAATTPAVVAPTVYQSSYETPSQPAATPSQPAASPGMQQLPSGGIALQPLGTAP
ncbi:hypothetical protein [Aeoliella sp.]|uniref:hypothetical protein n=1 Tax=Aeoliella sp. TaxID=2795800 RepID=UPI003CCC0DC5